MANNRHARRRLWRWRRSPLRRPSDRMEAWIVLAAWGLAVTGGLGAGALASQAMVESMEAGSAARHQVNAVLTSDAPDAAADGLGNNQVRAPVRWTAGDGSVHTATTRVHRGTSAGTPVTIWVDARGGPTSPPPSEVEKAIEATFAGAMAAGAFGGLTLLGGRIARIPLDRRRLRQWGEEWDRVGPNWRRQAL